MRFFIQLVLLSLICSCSGSFHSRPSEKERIVNEIISKTSKKLRNEMSLIPFGDGAQMMDQIQWLSLAFQCRHPVDVKEGRRMLVQATREFLNEINSNKKAFPYLDTYPFEPKNIEILILLQKPDGRNVDVDELSLIVVRRGLLQYKFEKLNSFEFRVYEETFEEACKILEEEI